MVPSCNERHKKNGCAVVVNAEYSDFRNPLTVYNDIDIRASQD